MEETPRQEALSSTINRTLARSCKATTREIMGTASATRTPATMEDGDTAATTQTMATEPTKRMKSILAMPMKTHPLQ